MYAGSGVKHQKSNQINQIILLTVLKVYDTVVESNKNNKNMSSQWVYFGT
jgi:hypothetical protein